MQPQSDEPIDQGAIERPCPPFRQPEALLEQV